MKNSLKTSRNATVFIFAGVLFSSFILSCTSQEEAVPPKLEPAPAPEPELSIEKIELIDMSFEDIELLVDLTISNPAPFNISPSGLDYSLEVWGEPLFSGRSEDIQSVPGKSRLSLSVPIKMDTAKIKEITETAGETGEFEYTLHTVADIPMPLTGRPIRVSRSHEGSFPLPRYPEIRVEKLDIKDFGSRTVSFELVIQISNPNVCTVTCGGISYDFLVDKKSWVSGNTSRHYEIPPGKTRSIPVPVHFNYLQAGRRIVDVLVGDKTIEYSLRGDASASMEWKHIEAGPFNFTYATTGTAVIVRPEQFGF